MAEQFVPQHDSPTQGPDRSTQDFYLRQLEKIAGQPEGAFTGEGLGGELAEQRRSTRIQEAEHAYDLFRQNATFVWEFNAARERWMLGGRRGAPPEMAHLNDEEAALVRSFLPGFGETLQSAREARLFGQKAVEFIHAAAGLEDIHARFGNEPGHHAPTLLPAMNHWYSQYAHEGATNQLLLGAASYHSAEGMLRMIHMVDPQAALTVTDLEQLYTREGKMVPQDGPFTFRRGNIIERGQTLGKETYDAIYEHLLFWGGYQLQEQPIAKDEVSGGLIFSPAAEASKDEDIGRALRKIRLALKPGGAAFLMERIDSSNVAEVERVMQALVKAGFAREDITMVGPAQRFATRRDVDAFFASGNPDVADFVARQQETSGTKVVVDDVDYEPTTLFIVKKSVDTAAPTIPAEQPPQPAPSTGGLFGRFKKRP